MAAKKKVDAAPAPKLKAAPNPPPEPKNPFCIADALRALAQQARDRSDEIAAAVHPNNVFPIALSGLAAQLDGYADLMEERGHDGIPSEVS